VQTTVKRHKHNVQNKPPAWYVSTTTKKLTQRMALSKLPLLGSA